MRTVFYTALIGAYDSLPTFRTYDEQAEYVFLTDCVDNVPRPWKPVYIDSYFVDHKITSGFLKANADLLFGDDCVAVWLDANARDISVDSDQVHAFVADHPIAALKHPQRSSVVEEAWTVAQLGLEHPSRIRVWLSAMTEARFPDQMGLSETGFLVRDLTFPVVRRFNRIWWDCIARLSRRDQLSFEYSLWKTGLRKAIVPVDRRLPDQLLSFAEHAPSSVTVREALSESRGFCGLPPNLIEPAMPELPAHYPGVGVWHAEEWSSHTLALLRRLNAIASSAGEATESDCCYFENALVNELTPPDPRRSWRREYLRHAAAPAQQILQVGFGAGRSAAIVLGLSNDSTLVAIDPGARAHSVVCSEAIAKTYGDRFELKSGEPVELLEQIPDEQARSFDLVHIEVCGDDAVFEAQLQWFLSRARIGCRLLVGDAYIPHVRGRLQKACDRGLLDESETAFPSSGENRLFALVGR